MGWELQHHLPRRPPHDRHGDERRHHTAVVELLEQQLGIELDPLGDGIELGLAHGLA